MKIISTHLVISYSWNPFDGWRTYVHSHHTKERALDHMESLRRLYRWYKEPHYLIYREVVFTDDDLVIGIERSPE